MPQQPVTLINILKVDPARQQELIATLKDNTETVIATLAGWKSTRLIAARDGASVTICSEWETPEAVQAMRTDPRMIAYFPKIRELASLESSLGDVVLDHRP
jgi:quinol monooxygenase YgiN